MNVSEAILNYLSLNGIKEIYGIPSGTLGGFLDAMCDEKDIDYIVTKNEAASSYSACKYAKVSQKIGVCALSGSVGVANAMNGIAEAAQCRAPMLIISGHVNQEYEGLGAIQELESIKLLKGIVKYSIKIEKQEDTIKELKKAMEIAMTHPRGPVDVGLPVNLQKEEFTGEMPQYITPDPLTLDFTALDQAVKMLNNIEKGLIIVGGGCRGLGSSIKKLAEKLNWRLVTTHSAKAVVEESFRLHMGNYGFPGTDLANEYVDNGDYDCIIALGSNLGETATLNFNKNLSTKKLIHIHVDESIFNRAYKATISITSELKDAIEYLTEHLQQKNINNDVINSLNRPYIKDHTGLSLRLFYEKITDYLPKNTFYMNDIGETIVFVNKFLKLYEEGEFECNINYGCMGSSVGALGVSRIDPQRQVAVFVGDGSFYMNIMSELLTAKKYNMKIIFFVINNSNLGFVNRGQQAIFGRTLSSFSDPYVDICRTVQAMGIAALKIRDISEMSKLIDFMICPNGPQVVEVITDSSEPVPTNRFKSLEK